MSGVVRLGDNSSGVAENPADPWPATALVNAGQSTVYADNILVGVVGGSFATHTKGRTTHYVDVQRKISSGSPSVFVENKPLARAGDSVADGDQCVGCSSDVFAN
jgi:uncharacterized Zn-binding protein involved in type VI secretion